MGIPGKGERRGDKWPTSLRQSSWCKCKGREVAVQGTPRGKTDLRAALAPSRASQGCLEFSPGGEAQETSFWTHGDYVPLGCFSLFHVETQAQTCTPIPQLSPKGDCSISNWPPTSVPIRIPIDFTNLTQFKLDSPPLPHPHFLLHFLLIYIYSGTRLQTSETPSFLPHGSSPPLLPHNCYLCPGSWHCLSLQLSSPKAKPELQQASCLQPLTAWDQPHT